MKLSPAVAAATALILGGCATTSGVMEAEGGTYVISARAAPARGGAAGAMQVAYEEAQKFCASKGGRAVLVDARDRDVYQSAIGGSSSGFAGATAAGGNATIRFRCAR